MDVDFYLYYVVHERKQTNVNTIEYNLNASVLWICIYKKILSSTIYAIETTNQYIRKYKVGKHNKYTKHII